jgi:outer membrane protein TolC
MAMAATKCIEESVMMTRQVLSCRLLTALTVAIAAGGCASFSKDGGFTTVEQIAAARIGKDVTWAKTADQRETIASRVAELLAQPLTVDAAVQIALLNNRELQAGFYELGIAEADLVQAGRLPNPRFSMFRALRGDDYKIEQALTFNIFSLVSMPLATAVEQRRFARTQQQVAMDVLRLAAATRKAYFVAVAANETARYMEQVKAAADAGAELARRMAQAGNWSRLNQAREQGFYAEAALTVARAAQAQTAAREQLVRRLGLWGAQTQFQLPTRLPELPPNADELPNIEQLAMEQRLDLQALRLETAALAKNLGLTKATRLINVLEFGPARVLEGQRSDPYKNGYEISFELPIFDWGGAKVAKAEAIYLQALDRAAAAAINARSEVRESYQDYRASYDIARHYRDEIVPLRKLIAGENQLRYNGMLIGVFDLLADARVQIASVNGYIEALRDFWLAQSDLQMALIGSPVAGAVARAATVAQPSVAGH